MENARLVRWLKNVGDSITQGEPLLELETEKSVVEIEATASGRLVEQLLQVDQEASVGDRVAWLETDTPASASSGEQATGAPTSVQPTPTPIRGSVQPSASAPMSGTSRASLASATATSAAAESRANGRVRSSPVARRLAEQNGVDLGTVVGSGPRGRVQLIDVRRAIEARSAQSAGRSIPAAPQALSSMRRALAR